MSSEKAKTKFSLDRQKPLRGFCLALRPKNFCLRQKCHAFWPQGFLRKLFLLFLIIIYLSLNGCVSVYNPATGKKEWYLIDEKGEISWGKAMAREFINQNKMLNDPAVLTYVRRVGNTVASVSHRNNLDYQFYVIDDKQMNALAIPGGHIFIYKGLVDKINEPELAFVLAHEIGHVSARHSLKKLSASLGFSILAATLIRKPDQAQAKQMVDQVYGLIALGYSRKDELEADSLAFQYVVSSAYSPQAAITLFKKLEAENKTHGRVPFYLSSHPHPEARIKNIEEKLSEAANFQAGGEENLRSRTYPALSSEVK